MFKQGYLDVPRSSARLGRDSSADMETIPTTCGGCSRRAASRLPQAVDINNWYLGFNWLDPVVGGRHARAAEEPQAAPGAVDRDRLGGGATAASSAGGGVAAPGRCRRAYSARELTPEGINPVTHRAVNGQPVRRPIEDAKRLLAEAGYRTAATPRPASRWC